jgi:hypothetical protein
MELKSAFYYCDFVGYDTVVSGTLLPTLLPTYSGVTSHQFGMDGARNQMRAKRQVKAMCENIHLTYQRNRCFCS